MSTPLTPMWRPITRKDLPLFQEHYEKYGNYSDFNPLCMYAFLGKNGRWAMLGDTILLDVEDSLYGGKYCSIIGLNDCYESIMLFLELERIHATNSPLLLYHVPKPTAIRLKGMAGIQHVTHDSNNDDYIYSVHRLIQLDSENLSKKKKHIQNLQTSHPQLHTAVADHTDDLVVQQMLQVFDQWIDQTNALDYHGERQAITRLLKLKSSRLLVVGIYDGPEMVAFTINEPEINHYYQGHFGKASRKYPHLSVYIEHETAKIMHERYESKFLNIQQDHGIIGLRHYKRSWDPVRYMRKYLVVVDKHAYANSVSVNYGGYFLPPIKRTVQHAKITSKV